MICAANEAKHERAAQKTAVTPEDTQSKITPEEREAKIATCSRVERVSAAAADVARALEQNVTLQHRTERAYGNANHALRDKAPRLNTHL